MRDRKLLFARNKALAICAMIVNRQRDRMCTRTWGEVTWGGRDERGWLELIHAPAQNGLALLFSRAHFFDLTFDNFKSVCVELYKLLIVHFAPGNQQLLENNRQLATVKWKSKSKPLLNSLNSNDGELAVGVAHQLATATYCKIKSTVKATSQRPRQHWWWTGSWDWMCRKNLRRGDLRR